MGQAKCQDTDVIVSRLCDTMYDTMYHADMILHIKKYLADVLFVDPFNRVVYVPKFHFKLVLEQKTFSYYFLILEYYHGCVILCINP